MGENKKLRKQILSLLAVISEHEQKIAIELQKPNPDTGLVWYWQKEIAGRQKEISRKLEKLGGAL